MLDIHSEIPALAETLPPLPSAATPRRRKRAPRAARTPLPPSWQATLEVGDVVLFRFPVAEEGGDAGASRLGRPDPATRGSHGAGAPVPPTNCAIDGTGRAAPLPQPKVRPCLVMEIETRAGLRVATLAYGTDVHARANTGYEIRLRQPGALAAAGLHKPTRFVGGRRLTVSLDHAGFEVHPVLLTAVIGGLAAPERARLDAVRARLQAEADIAAHHRTEARRERREARRPSVATPRLVPVERRHPAPKLMRRPEATGPRSPGA